jgi:hypothetical protein
MQKVLQLAWVGRFIVLFIVMRVGASIRHTHSVDAHASLTAGLGILNKEHTFLFLAAYMNMLNRSSKSVKYFLQMGMVLRKPQKILKKCFRL